MIAAAALFALTILVGDWQVSEGALEGQAPQGDQRRAVAAALVAADGSPERIEATVGGGGRGAAGGGSNAFILFDIERGADGRVARARIAGLFLGGKRAVIGELRAGGGRPEMLAEAPCDVKPGQTYRLKVTLEGAKAALAVDGAEVVSHTFDARRGAGAGVATFGRARFDDVVVGAAGQTVADERFDDRTDGPLAAGDMSAPSPISGGETPMQPPTMQPTPMSTPAPLPTGTGDGGYAGGSLGPCPGLDGPLGEDSWKVAPETRKLFRRLYIDLIGRGPTEKELLAAAAAGREAAVDGLLKSEDLWRNWYEEELFYFLLIDQFRPTSEPLASLPTRLARGEADPRAALMEIVISQYFNARNPGNDTFVTVVLEQVLGMKVQDKENVATLEAGKKLYDGAQAKFLGETGSSQADVVRIAFAKKGFSERYVDRLYRRLTGAELGAAARAAAAERFEKDPRSLAALVREWVLSPEYATRLTTPRAKTDPQWIRTLYADLLGARPDYKEFRDTRNALLALADSTPIRLVLGRVIVDSKKADRASAGAAADAEKWVKERFLLLLGRAPNHEEIADYTVTLKELGPKDGPRVVLRAIVSSQEYQRY